MKSVPWHKSVTYNSVPLNKKGRKKIIHRKGAENAKERKREIKSRKITEKTNLNAESAKKS
ncbi:MAG: hypothetical protein ACYSR1_05100 [Planctomycetota bacterium]|jgi:hypothetical protein